MRTSETSVPAEEDISRHCKPSWNIGGTRSTLRFYIGVVTSIFLVNICWLLYARVRYNFDGITGTIWDGDCEKAHTIDFWLHLLINILSTLLLTGSNIFMAIFNSPSRKEVDKAHSKGKWLNIGLLSLRNMPWISRKKAFVCAILGLTSIPFHLIYNSMVYASISTNQYRWAIAPENYTVAHAQSATFQPSREDLPYRLNSDNEEEAPQISDTDNQNHVKYFMKNMLTQARTSKSYHPMNAKDCLAAYSNPFRPNRRNVVVLVDTAFIAKTQNITALQIFWSETASSTDIPDPSWLCFDQKPDPDTSEYDKDVPSVIQTAGKRPCNGSYIPGLTSEKTICHYDDLAFEKLQRSECRLPKLNAENWRMAEAQVKSCIVEEIDNRCAVKFDLNIMIVIICLNLTKLGAMWFVLYRIDAEALLNSVGDAAISFLKRPDSSTQGVCLASSAYIRKFWPRASPNQRYKGDRVRWAQAVTPWRIAALITFMFVCIGLLGGALAYVFVDAVLPDVRSVSEFAALGFGTVKAGYLVDLKNSENISPRIAMLRDLFFANSPQVLLSIVAVSYNSMMSSIFAARDWNNFTEKPQAFMVAAPEGMQRATWLLGTPWKFGLSVLISQAFIHWTISRAVFPVQIRIFSVDGTLEVTDEVYKLGISPIPILVVALISLWVLGSIIFIIRMKSPPGGAPIVSTCSAAISAACHSELGQEEGFEYRMLRWGELEDQEKNGSGHCSFATEDMWESGQVGPPVLDKLYK